MRKIYWWILKFFFWISLHDIIANLIHTDLATLSHPPFHLCSVLSLLEGLSSNQMEGSCIDLQRLRTTLHFTNVSIAWTAEVLQIWEKTPNLQSLLVQLICFEAVLRFTWACLKKPKKLRGKWPYSFISWTNKWFLKAWKFCINNVNGACTTYEKFLIKRRHQWFCYAILPYKYFWLKYLCLSHVLLNFLSVKTSESIILLICSMQCSYSKLFS